MLGAVVAGSPAYEAGLMAGDEIVAIDDRRDLGFTDLLQKVLLSSQGPGPPLRGEAAGTRRN